MTFLRDAHRGRPWRGVKAARDGQPRPMPAQGWQQAPRLPLLLHAGARPSHAASPAPHSACCLLPLPCRPCPPPDIFTSRVSNFLRYVSAPPLEGRDSACPASEECGPLHRASCADLGILHHASHAPGFDTPPPPPPPPPRLPRRALLSTSARRRSCWCTTAPPPTPWCSPRQVKPHLRVARGAAASRLAAAREQHALGGCLLPPGADLYACWAAAAAPAAGR